MSDRARMLGAVSFMVKAHGDQKRNYTGEPYAVHPLEVAGILADYGFQDEVVIAGLFHDVVEDTKVTLEDIKEKFGHRIAKLVEEVTDVSTPLHGNRATRKGMNREHLAKASYYGQSIKVADLISNSRDIMAHDPNFAKVYLKEKEALLEVLVKADDDLLSVARAFVIGGQK